MKYVMKKMYKQPIVNSAEIQLMQALLGGSPGMLENSGKGTTDIPGNGDVIGG